MAEPPQTDPPIKPYFVPEGIAFDTLPQPLQMAFEQVIQPAYCELVLGSKTALERATAASVVFLIALELLDQFALGRDLDFAQAEQPDEAKTAAREKLISRHLKLLVSKQQAANFLVKLKAQQGLFYPPHKPG